jgi:hypothetical protein
LRKKRNKVFAMRQFDIWRKKENTRTRRPQKKKMGCDYYSQKILCIQFKHKIIADLIIALEEPQQRWLYFHDENRLTFDQAIEKEWERTRRLHRSVLFENGEWDTTLRSDKIKSYVEMMRGKGVDAMEGVEAVVYDMTFQMRN